MPGASSTFVLPHRDVANPMQTILNAPVAASQVEKVLRVGSAGTKTRDRVGDIGHSPVADDSCSLDANGLPETRPVQKTTKPPASLKMADFYPPMPLIDFTNLVKLLTAKAFAVGGKGRD